MKLLIGTPVYKAELHVSNASLQVVLFQNKDGTISRKDHKRVIII